MTRLFRVLLGAVFGGMVWASVLAAQGTVMVGPDLWSGVSLASAAGALIAWGSQSERVKGHSRRIDELERDRVTRAEHEAMRDDHKAMREDIHHIRDLLERRREPR